MAFVKNLGLVNTPTSLFSQAVREMELLREASPTGTYEKVNYTLFAIN